jgi:hypothetical protein
MMNRCEENPVVLLVLNQERAQADLDAAALRCPGCAGQLRSWGFARSRSLRLSCGARTWLRPRRTRCASCAATHVLLPAQSPPRHAYAIDVVGQALLARATGHGYRTISADLNVPADTVRGWVRRATGRAEWLRVEGLTTAHECDSTLPAVDPAGAALADALVALGTAAAAVTRLLGPIGAPWQIIAMIARGQLIAPVRSG